MDIITKVTYYPLKMADGLFHIFRKTEITSPVIGIEESDIDPFDDYNLASDMASVLNEIENEKDENEDLSNIQITP